MKWYTIFCVAVIYFSYLPAQSQEFGGYQFVSIPGTVHDLAYDAKRNVVYVSNASGNKIDVINLDTLLIQTSIPVGINPMGMAVTPDCNQLFVTLYGEEKMSVVDLNTQTEVRKINLPPGLSRNNPLRVDFDAKGTAIWRDGSGSNPYGYLYSLNLTNDISSRLLSDQPGGRYGFNMNKSKFIYVVDGAKISIWDAITQTYSAPVSLSSYGFSNNWWDWPIEGTINNNGNTLLVCKASTETWVFDQYLQKKGMINIEMGWGTFGK